MGLDRLSAVVGHSACFTPKATVGYVDSGDFPTSSGSVKRHPRSRVWERKGKGTRHPARRVASLHGAKTGYLRWGEAWGLDRRGLHGGTGGDRRTDRVGLDALDSARSAAIPAKHHTTAQDRKTRHVAVSTPDYNTISSFYNGSIL